MIWRKAICPDKEFKIMITKIRTGFEKRVDKLNENFNKEIKKYKKDLVISEEFNKLNKIY